MFGFLGLRLAFAIVALAGSFVATYPATPRGTASDTYFGMQVPDPYRWLERVNDAKTKHWVEAQTHLTEQTLAQMPDRARMALVLRYYSDMSYDEIADTLGVRRAFVGVLLLRARHQLREILAEGGGGMRTAAAGGKP